jgi:hypothetical protein
VDGRHTLAQVQAQMALLRRARGPRAHAQLIGGEVTLLYPDDHAAALQIMRAHGREPMSMSHGDFDYGYLERLVLAPGGRRRLGRVSFAAHFDSLMFGRRGIARPPDEASLNPYRARFAAMFARLRREHKVRSFLAHNMTATPANLGQIAAVVRDCQHMGYGMFSFQPTAFVGDDRRWHEDYRDVTGDQVWAEIERGAGTKVDHHVFEHGDVRCNRAAYGFWAGDRWYPVLDGSDHRDIAVRDAFFRYFGPVSFTGTPIPLLAGKIAVITAAHPRSPPPPRRRRAPSRPGGSGRWSTRPPASGSPSCMSPAGSRSCTPKSPTCSGTPASGCPPWSSPTPCCSAASAWPGSPHLPSRRRRRPGT